MERQPFLTHCFVLIICQNTKTGKFLCVKETKNRGWWVPAGLVEPGEDFYSAAIRETKEEAGVDIKLKGILRVEHSVYGHQTARMRVIFFATSDNDTPKQISDRESECAVWFSIQEIENLQKIKPGLRGPEILEWPIYIENKGNISPIEFLAPENVPVILPSMFKKENSGSAEEFIKYLMDQKIDKLKQFLSEGFNPNFLINDKKWTALHYAIKIKNQDMVKLLLINSANPQLKTTKKRNCFHFAMQSSFKILKMLLVYISDLEEEEFKSIINFQDEFGDTPLHILCRDIIKYNSTDLTIFKYYINLGGDPNIKNDDNISPSEYLNDLL